MHHACHSFLLETAVCWLAGCRFVRYSYPTMGVGGKRVLNVGLLVLNSSTLVLAIVQLGTHWHGILSKVKGYVRRTVTGRARVRQTG